MNKSLIRDSTVILVLMLLVALILFTPSPNPTNGQFTVDDVSKPQQFTLHLDTVFPVWFRYRVEGTVDDSASVWFRTDTDSYGHVRFKGMVADSTIRDFYEHRDMHIYYTPRGVKKGRLVIKASFHLND